MAGLGKRRYGHRGDVADIHHADSCVLHGHVDGVLARHGVREPERVLHEIVRPQVRVGDAGLLELLFGLPVPAQKRTGDSAAAPIAESLTMWRTPERRAASIRLPCNSTCRGSDDDRRKTFSAPASAASSVSGLSKSPCT